MITLSKNGKIEVDAIFYNASIYSLAKQEKNNSYDLRLNNKQAMAVCKGKIAAIGDLSYIQLQFYTQNLINLQGYFVFPSFIDAHVHLLGLGLILLQADLVSVTSKQEIFERLRTQPICQGWVQGYGWDQNLWPNQEMPNEQDKEELDRLFPDTPVWLWRIDGHAAWVNSVALRLAGITASTCNPDGGKILHDSSTNALTGVLLDNAISLVKTYLPDPDIPTLERALKSAMQECFRNGVTCVHDAGQNWENIALYQRYITESKMSLRVYVMLDGMNKDTWNKEKIQNRPQQIGQNRLTVQAIKLYSDGALGSRGALLLEDYSDQIGNCGIEVLSEEALIKEVKKIAEYNLQPCIHAIGDRANRNVLNAIEQALSPEQRLNLRPRIEHAQLLHPSDIPRFSQLNIIASMQPTHATSDMNWVANRLGQTRLQGAYCWQSLLASGCCIAGGSDAPIERINPLAGIYAAVTRQDKFGNPKNGWMPEQIISRQNAISFFTKNAAYAGFAENILGTLEPGKWADFVVLDKDILQIPTQEILTTKVLQTYIAGQMCFGKI